MPTWDPTQYLQFADLRERPCRDLAARVFVPNARRIVDLGCGTGNSSGIVAERWPEASVMGIDNSAAMIAAAQAAWPDRRWKAQSVEDWVASEEERYDIVFSNAALQWVTGHATLFPALLDHVEPGGALAIQMPGNYHAAQNLIPRELARSEAWRRWFPTGKAVAWYSHDLDFYYDTLAPVASRLDLWATEYVQIMANVEAIVEWYKATGLRPYLDAIGEESERERFLSEYLERLRPHYPVRAAGGVLFIFRRIFVVAYR